MTKSEIFKKAHQMAKEWFVNNCGHYLACFKGALKSVYQELKQAKKMVEIKFSMAKGFGSTKSVVMTLEGYGHGFGAINPEALGFKKITSNKWTKTCYTSQEIDAAREPLKSFVTNRRVGNAVILEV